MKEAPFLSVEEATVAFGKSRILDGISLSVRKGEFVALLGASGCGKTTLLRSIAGFQPLSTGRILINGEDVTQRPPERRDAAMVFQSYALWPHMTVAATIGYGLKLQGLRRADIVRRVEDMLALLGLEGLGGRKPAQLSGGQRQRVALGRALAVNPALLLLDEPMSNLDARIRLTVRHEIRALQQRLGITAIHVTHDREEAMVMADRIVILDKGCIVQAGAPEEVFNKPASSFVAAFMGAENCLLLRGRSEGGSAAAPVLIEAGDGYQAVALPSQGRMIAGPIIEARFRNEAAQLLPAGGVATDGAPAFTIAGKVTMVGYPGGVWRHTVATALGDVIVDSPAAMPVDSAVHVRIPAEGLYLFNPPASGEAGGAAQQAA